MRPIPAARAAPDLSRLAFPLVLVVLGAVIVAVVCLVDRGTGFNLADAGYLWYGVQRVLAGGVPIRDFSSYDPLRYYWAAGWLWLFHARGILAVRDATAAFSAVGVVTAGLLVWSARRNYRVRFAPSMLIMVLCVLWMAPWWKQYDAAISIVLVAGLAWALSSPVWPRSFVCGIVVGVAALVGQNHGVYGMIASMLAVPVLVLGGSKMDWWRCALAWSCGVVVGFSPMVFAVVVDHAFAARLFEGIKVIFELKTTNIALPVPWPWTVAITGYPIHAVVRSVLVGCFFILLPLFCVVGSVKILLALKNHGKAVHPVFIACVLTAIPYLNVAFSRADVSHLSQAAMPCLIGLVVWRWSFVGRGIAASLLAALVAASAWVAIPAHSAYQKFSEPGWVRADIDGDWVWMRPLTASYVALFNDLASKYAPGGEPILAVPVFPGAYALLHTRSPVYEVYPLFPRTQSFQEAEIRKLSQARPRVVVVNNAGVDGRNDLRYENTHRLVWGYIEAHYHQVIDIAHDKPWLKVYLPN